MDLYKLVLAISHNTSPVYLVNFIESNYTDLKLDYQKLHCLSEEEKLKELKNILNAFFVKRMDMSWESVLNEVSRIVFASSTILGILSNNPFRIYQPLQAYQSTPWSQESHHCYLSYDPDRYLAHTFGFKAIYTRRFS